MRLKALHRERIPFQATTVGRALVEVFVLTQRRKAGQAYDCTKVSSLKTLIRGIVCTRGFRIGAQGRTIRFDIKF